MFADSGGKRLMGILWIIYLSPRFVPGHQLLLAHRTGLIAHSIYKYLAAHCDVIYSPFTYRRKGEVFKQKRTHNVCCGFFGFLTWYLASSNLVLGEP